MIWKNSSKKFKSEFSSLNYKNATVIHESYWEKLHLIAVSYENVDD